MEDVLGVYICSGCGIGDAVDLSKAEKVANNEYKAKVCKTHEALCGDEGVQMIKSDIESDGLNKLAVCACSSRVMTEAFNFNGTLVERVNLRELVVWSHPPNDEDTQMLAEDYLRMGIARARTAEVPKPFET